MLNPIQGQDWEIKSAGHKDLQFEGLLNMNDFEMYGYNRAIRYSLTVDSLISSFSRRGINFKWRDCV